MDPKVAALLQLFRGIRNVTISRNSLIASNNPVNTLSFPVPVSVTSSVGPKAPSVHPLNVAALPPQNSVRQSTSQPPCSNSCSVKDTVSLPSTGASAATQPSIISTTPTSTQATCQEVGYTTYLYCYYYV